MAGANSVVILVTAAGPERRGRALGIMAATQAIGFAIGPTAGGVLLGTLGWRWIFWVNVPLSILAFVLSWLIVPKTTQFAGDNPYSRGPFTAGDVAAALRLTMDIAPPVVPSRYGPDDGVVFRRHQRASEWNGSRLDANGFDWRPAEDTDDRATDSGHAFNGEATLSRDDLKVENAPGTGDGPLDPLPLKEGGQHFRVIAPRATAMFIDHGPWSMGRHALPPRGRNLDLEKRSRAKLREECRFDPSAFSRAVPADIWSRVTISDKLAEANALLDVVDDKRKWIDWLTAPVDEPVVVKDYRTPKPRLRGRQHPGIAITGAGEDVLLVLLDADRALPPHAGARRNRHAH